MQRLVLSAAGLRVSTPGKDVLDPNLKPNELLFDSSLEPLHVWATGVASVGKAPVTINFPALPFFPFYLIQNRDQGNAFHYGGFIASRNFNPDTIYAECFKDKLMMRTMYGYNEATSGFSGFNPVFLGVRWVIFNAQAAP